MPERAQLSRRSVLAAAGAGVLGLSGCSSTVTGALTGASAPNDVVKFWNFFGGGDGERMTAMVGDYRAANPDINIRATTSTWGNPFYTKLTLGTLADQPPQVASMHLDRLVTPVQSDLLRPFDIDELARWGITADRFVPRAWDASQLEGQVWAIPLDYHPLAVYYNRPLAEQAGLLDDDGQLRDPVGTAGFEDMLAAAKDALDGAPPTGIADDAVSHYRVFYTLLSQLGGSLVNEDGSEAVLERDLFFEVMTWMRSLTQDKQLLDPAIDGSGAIANFTNGRYAFFISGGWERPTFADAGVDFSIRSYPRVYDRHVAWDGTHSFVIPRYDATSQDRIDSAHHFIAGMLERSATWCEGGHLTTWLPVAGEDGNAGVRPHYENLPADGSQYDPQVWYAGSGSNLQTVVGSPLASCTAGFITVEQAYERALSGLSELASTPPPR